VNKTGLAFFLKVALFAGSAAIASSPLLADVKAGVDAWSAGDYDAAVREWKPLAAKGDPDAEFNLAQAYKLGRGVPLDLAKAQELYGKAAAQGHLQAADNYGLLMFQNGERERALPYIKAAASRGDARAQYILGVAHFNGDLMPKDWVRAYALVSLAQQAGLPQATRALAQMDEHIPLADRQKSVALAAQIAAEADATRTREIAATELGTPESPPKPTAKIAAAPARPMPGPAPRLAAAPDRGTPATAGADFTRKGIAASPPSPTAELPRPAPKAVTTSKPAAPAMAASGPWKIQLGAFGVSGNAEKLWSKLSGRPELKGHSRLLLPAGSLTRLLAAGYASKAEAEGACAALRKAGQDCLVTQ